MTYKQRLNAVLELDKDTEHSLQDLKDITGIPISILKEVEKRGYGAYSNLASVRLKDFSKNPDLRKQNTIPLPFFVPVAPPVVQK